MRRPRPSPSGGPWPHPVSLGYSSTERPCRGASGLPGLHVGGDGAALSQTLEAFVGVVQEHPVLGFEVRLARAGCSHTQRRVTSPPPGALHERWLRPRSLRSLRPTWLKDVGLWEVVKVGGVVDALDLDGDGRGPLPGGAAEGSWLLWCPLSSPLKPSPHVPDVLPVHRLKKLMTLDLLHVGSSDPVLGVGAVPEPRTDSGSSVVWPPQFLNSTAAWRHPPQDEVFGPL